MAKGGKLKEWAQKRKWRIKLKTWMLFIVLLPLLFMDATLLRNDHIKMTELRDQVIAIDAKIGEDTPEEEVAATDEELAAALTNLKEFIFSNIVVNVIEENGAQKVTFGTGPFYLEHSYIRAANIALTNAEKELSSDANPNGNIYAAASSVCQPQAIKNGWNWTSPGYINCMMGELQKYPSASEIQDTVIAKLPSTELYRHNYASPVWAPTLTGFMLLITLFIVIIILFRFIMWLFLRIAILFIKI